MAAMRIQGEHPYRLESASATVRAERSRSMMSSRGEPFRAFQPCQRLVVSIGVMCRNEQICWEVRVIRKCIYHQNAFIVVVMNSSVGVFGIHGDVFFFILFQ